MIELSKESGRQDSGGKTKIEGLEEKTIKRKN